MPCPSNNHTITNTTEVPECPSSSNTAIVLATTSPLKKKTAVASSPPASKRQRRTESPDTKTDPNGTTTTNDIAPHKSESTLTPPSPPLNNNQTPSSSMPELISEQHNGMEPTSPVTIEQSSTSQQQQQQHVEEGGRSKRNRAPISYKALFKMGPARAHATVATPRWHTQAYMVFLALREHPNRCLSRPDLILAALAMDEKISKERNLPRVFNSKTPENSASAVLTCNADRYYIPYKPEGSRSTWFKLAYTPGSFDQAYEEYKKWMAKLTQHDWLYCFGVPLAGSVLSTDGTPDQDSLLNTAQAAASTTESAAAAAGAEAIPTPEPLPTTEDEGNNSTGSDTNKKKSGKKKKTAKSKLSVTDRPSSSRTLTTQLQQQPPAPVYQLDQLDLTHVPQRWQDIVHVAPSKIPNGGQGLFAARDLPYNTPLGFYFGVPMTECEFDSIKEKVGRASQYSILYRRTVLDATDAQGEPYTLDNDVPLCPFHYMNEAKDETMANILFIEGIVVNQVICWSKRLILPGEELLVWYGNDVNRFWMTK